MFGRNDVEDTAKLRFFARDRDTHGLIAPSAVSAHWLSLIDSIVAQGRRKKYKGCSN